MVSIAGNRRIGDVYALYESFGGSDGGAVNILDEFEVDIEILGENRIRSYRERYGVAEFADGPYRKASFCS